MKSKLILSISLVSFLFSCKKDEAVKLPLNAVVIAETCSNGIKDANELGVDCGGPNCAACELSLPNCSLFLSDNQVEYSGFTTNTYSSSVISSSIISGKLVVNTGGSAPIKFTFPSSNPTFFTSYTITNNPNPTGNQVYVQHTRGFYNFVGTLGLIHINVIDGNNVIEFCDVELNDFSYSLSTTARGKIIF